MKMEEKRMGKHKEIKTKMKMEDRGMEEPRRMWKVKVWRSLEDTYACGGENWEKYIYILLCRYIILMSKIEK